MTVLSGDIGSDDVTVAYEIVTNVDDIKDDNSNHVVTAINVDNSTVLDGFTITAGQADGDAQPNIWGDGFFCNDCSPNLNNITFSSN